MNKAKRYIAARTLHLGCNMMDSVRVMSWYKVIMTNRALTDKEYRLIEQRSEKVKELVADVRKIANHIEKQAKI